MLAPRRELDDAEDCRLVEIERYDRGQRAVAARGGDRHLAIDGDGQDEAVVVVRVLTDQVDTARRANDDVRIRVEGLPKCIEELTWVVIAHVVYIACCERCFQVRRRNQSMSVNSPISAS